MIRLTFREKEKFGVVGMNEANQDKKLYSCVLKLIDYEDTGLSPNDILKLKEENDSYNETMKYLNKLRDENNQLKQQFAEKDKEIEKLRQIINTIQQNIRQYNKEDYEDKQLLYQDIDMLKQNQTQLAIQELEKVNGILTDIIIKVTENEFDLKKLCYLEEIFAKFGEKMQEQIKQLENNKKDY